MASKYAKASASSGQKSKNFFTAGHYLILVNRIKECQDSNEVHQVVLESTNLHTFPDSRLGRNYPTRDAIPALIAGQDADEVLKKTNPVYDSRLKSLALGVSGMSDAEFANAEMADWQNEKGEPQKGYQGRGIELMVSEAQPFAGQVIELIVNQQIKKKAREAKKTDDQLSVSTDFVNQLDFRRIVPFAEVQKIASAEVLKRFIPDIEAKVAAEAAEAQ